MATLEGFLLRLTVLRLSFIPFVLVRLVPVGLRRVIQDPCPWDVGWWFGARTTLLLDASDKLPGGTFLGVGHTQLQRLPDSRFPAVLRRPRPRAPLLCSLVLALLI